jgi:hypothetical protein
MRAPGSIGSMERVDQSVPDAALADTRCPRNALSPKSFHYHNNISSHGTSGGARGLAFHSCRRDLMAQDKPQDAIALLKADHRKVEDLFEKFEKASGDGRKRKLAEEICMELTIHSIIEEEIFYPACDGKVDEDDLKEAYVEHDGAKVLIAEIEAGGADDDFYDAKVKVLSEMIEHHVKEEEKQRDSLFAQAKKAELDMDALGAELAARKEELIANYQSSGTPKPETRTFTDVSV